MHDAAAASNPELTLFISSSVGKPCKAFHQVVMTFSRLLKYDAQVSIDELQCLNPRVKALTSPPDLPIKVQT